MYRAVLFVLLTLVWTIANANATADAQVEKLFDDVFESFVARSPEWQAELGRKTNYGKWDDHSERFSKKTYKLTQKQLKTLRAVDASKLSEQNQLSLSLYIRRLEQDIAHYQWRHHNYPVNQMFGRHTQLPAFLINTHNVDTLQDAEDYIDRLKGIPKALAQLQDGLERREKQGIVAPSFVFPHVQGSIENLLQGYPFEEGKDSDLMADFRQKVTALELDKKTSEKLLTQAAEILTKKVQPAYTKLSKYLVQLSKASDDKAGVWTLPEGEAFYRDALSRTTTTELTAEQIHQTGLDEVARIHAEMVQLAKQVKFKGDLKAFFQFMETDKQFYYENTEEGRQQYLAQARQYKEEMEAKLPTLFNTLPKAKLIVKAVEPFREKSAGIAFYQVPAPDGSRPGTFYANLYDMNNMPIYQMEALVYHEAVPGHHMQLSIAQELTDLPEFRKHLFYTAYVEGWGLYSEYLPKEVGQYKDPYSDFGRLAMELWRAARLVVDTGVHHHRWTREQAIEYLLKNTPTNQGSATKAIERYIVMPSQATAYKVGMLEILALREKAQQALGAQFDIRQFHDVILRDGALPLDVLTQQVANWIDSVKSAQVSALIPVLSL